MFDTQDQLNYPVNNPTCPQLGGARDARGARVDVVKARRVLGMTKAFNANLALPCDLGRIAGSIQDPD